VVGGGSVDQRKSEYITLAFVRAYILCADVRQLTRKLGKKSHMSRPRAQRVCAQYRLGKLETHTWENKKKREGGGLSLPPAEPDLTRRVLQYAIVNPSTNVSMVAAD
jgi:hypothetical protein